MHTLLKAFDREIVQDGDRLEFRKRPSGALVVALAIAVVAACVYGIGVALRSAGDTARALATFVIGGAGLMAIVGLLSFAGAIVLFLAPRLRVFAQVDRAARNVRIRNRIVPFGEIRPSRRQRRASGCARSASRPLAES